MGCFLVNVLSSASKQTKLAPLSDKASGAEIILLQDGSTKDPNWSLYRQSLNPSVLKGK